MNFKLISNFVYGILLLKIKSKVINKIFTIKFRFSGLNGESNKVGEFMYYSDSDDEDVDFTGIGFQPKNDKLSCNFVDCLGAREMGLPSVGGNRFFSERLSSEYGTRHMLSNGMMKETSIYMPSMDKIFCSKWLSHRQVVFGTKCNKVRLLIGIRM